MRNDTSLTARTPPKRLTRPSTSSTTATRRPAAVEARRSSRSGTPPRSRRQHLGWCEELVGSATEAHLPVLEEHRPLGDLEGHVDGLLDHEHRRARLVDLADLGHQLVDDGRRQAEGELVDAEQLRPGDHGHRQRELLLLAARQVAGVLFGALPQDREHRQDVLERLLALELVARFIQPARRRFSATVRVGKMPRPPGMSEKPSRRPARPACR